MKALTLTQPWATLIAIGAKRLETRSWSTSYRGPVAIHAAKQWPKWARAICLDEPFRTVLAAAHLRVESLPTGCVVATADLVACFPTSRELTGRWTDDLVVATRQAYLTNQEVAFGDFSTGRCAWLLANVRRCDPPIRATGALGLWEWPEGDRLLVQS